MLFYILTTISICLLIFGFFVIKDILYLANYIKYQRKIKIYNKNYKKYLDDKKNLLDKRLEQEKEIRKQYGMEFGGQEEEQEYIVGFIKPVGKHSNQEFAKNAPKYKKVMKMMEGLKEKGIKNAYWRIVTNTANKIAGPDKNPQAQQTKNAQEQQRRNENKGQSRGRGR